MEFSKREDIIEITPLWKGERFPDGRPKVPDEVIEKIRTLALEEVWEICYLEHYDNQFMTGFKSTHPGRKAPTVGRAVTTTFVPIRKDLDIAMKHRAMLQGMQGDTNLYNIWVVDNLVEDDVWVIDLFDKDKYGTIIGGNLGTCIKNNTKRGGAVVWGAVRDLGQLADIDEINVFYRKTDPTPLRDHTMISVNGPCRIGNAVCLPGDVVYACEAGVFFIPPHLAMRVVEQGEKTKVKDIFGFQRIKEGVYNGRQIDTFPWPKAMVDDLVEWIKTDPKGEPYRHLNFDQEYEEAETGVSAFNYRHWKDAQMTRLSELSKYYDDV